MTKSKIYSFISQYDKGMSNEQIAEKLNVAPKTIQRIKEGKYEPSVSLALELAKLLGCIVEDLFELVGEE
ncbi:helix-turn-helix transcriptional regulator [Enterococcus sp. 5H]|uniref:helix-turn-helix transcriptional regulator n=1 Tax=Enterococcus sp. 5H TaxID=1229490 RepID=UPI002303F7C7|nr:helix-turn-helix domain-containing protein [Enterococcus sp. 5H]MDA9472086.1 hypothetical protein [Enterococcus sp. 5H]